MTWTLDIPGWRPTLANELMTAHHMKAAGMKRKDADQIMTAMLVYGVPKAEGPRRVAIHIRGRYSRFPDPDAPLKSFLDALKTAGAIVDDDGARCVWSVPTFERGPKSTLITLEDL